MRFGGVVAEVCGLAPGAARLRHAICRRRGA